MKRRNIYGRSLACRTLTIAAMLWVAGAGAWCATDAYIGHVSDALTALETGQTGESLQSLKRAVAFNANDPLAHTAIGLTLLDGGRQDDALKEFNRAAELDSSCAEAVYGRALVYLSKRELGLATAYFCEAQRLDPDLEMRGSIEYVKALATGAYGDIADPGKDQSLRAMAAMGLMKAGNYAEARAVWTELQPDTVRPGFGERIGCSMTFAADSPVAVTGVRLTQPYSSPVPKEKSVTVAGSVVLKADLSRARGVKLVSFFVDNKLAAVTNQSPYNYSWNTERVPNGVHTIKILGCDEWGNTLSEKSTTVTVKNAGVSTPSPRVTGVAASRVWTRLWNAMRLKPSATAVNYNLALCALQQNDTETATAALERVMAADPDYMDADDRLARLYGANGARVVMRRGSTDGDRIALTFDDGPKANTGQLLDALKNAGVKATFFVVGKQAEAYPDTLKRMAAEGHEIQNHTYGHRDLEYLSDREIKQEVFRGQAVVRSIVGTRMACIRPPGGHEGKRLPAVAKKFGLTTILWSANCGHLEGTTKNKLRDFVVGGAEPGGIVLMHNLEVVTLNALPEIISALREKGYTFATLSELGK